MMRLLRLCFCLLPLTAAFVFSGCNTGDNVKRIVLVTNGKDPFWTAVYTGMKKAEEELNLGEAKLKVDMQPGDFTDDGQINILNQLAGQTDVAAVAISPVDPKSTGIAKAMKRLREQGIHVITLDSDMDREKHRDSRLLYIGTNNVVAGRELGKAAKGLDPDGARYVTFVGLTAAANAIERSQGFAEGAGSEFTLVDNMGDGGDENKAQDNVKTALKNHADLEMFVGIWAYNAHAIAEVVKDRVIRDNVKVLVFDAAELALKDMEEGLIDAMIVQNPYQMGRLGTKVMVDLYRGETDALSELFPQYDPETKEFGSTDGDIYHTELRMVVPDESSPLTPEMFDESTKFFTLDEFKTWLSERNLKNS